MPDPPAPGEVRGTASTMRSLDVLGGNADPSVGRPYRAPRAGWKPVLTGKRARDFRRPHLALTIVLLSLGLCQGCQVLTNTDLGGVHCEQEGVIGAPACPEDEACQNSVCVGCSTIETCGDGLDNDCNGAPDDGCAEAGPPNDAGDDGEAGNNLDDRVKGSLVVLYTFLEGSGSVVRDTSGVGTPLDLNIEPENAVHWPPGGGLSIDAPTMITSPAAASKITEVFQNANGITVEAWIQPDGLGQNGPARIVSLSADRLSRNFTLGQENSELDFRLRTTTATNLNGEPSVRSGLATLTTDLTHVVYVRNASGHARFVLNGVEEGTGEVPGEFSNWDSTYRFVLANEFVDDRNWRGLMYLVAVYARALTQTEVATNYAVGVPR
jgi:Concanavalin A-like lectin/glucanases superfamily